jgi:hypothetical protein
MRCKRWSFVILSFFTISCRAVPSQECGLNPAEKRVLLPWMEPDHPQALSLINVFKDSYSPAVEIAVEHSQSFGVFVSTDRGETWRISNNRRCSMMNALLPAGVPATSCFQSRSNPDIAWSQASRSSFECRKDTPRPNSFEVTPHVNGVDEIRIALLIGVSPRYESRLYARIKTNKNDFCIYRSDDSARTFTQLTCVLDYVVESQANPEVIFGLKEWSGIFVSVDGGIQWIQTNDHDVLSPLRLTKNDKGRNEFRTWDSGGSYVENRVTQIESDPFDVNTFYVLTFKGLFVTHDLGKTYRLLPIAMDFVQGVDRMGIDPIDSRYLYASVKLTDLYRSGDKGCSWVRVDLPRP